MMDFFLEPLQQSYFLKSLLGGCIVAIVCGVVGTLVILRRMAFLGDALSHVMIAGVAAGYLFMKFVFGLEAHAPGMLIGSLIASILTVGLIGFVSKVSRIKEDTAIGIMYCGMFAAGATMISVFNEHIHVDLVHFILGDVLSMADHDLWTAAFAGAIVLSAFILFFRHLQITSFDPVMAAALGFPILAVNYLLTGCVSLVVVSAISMVGVILVIGLLITPAATAYLLTDRLKTMMFLSVFFGITSVVGGLYLCIFLNSAGGSAIMLFSTFQFLVVLTFAPRYGLLANWLKRLRLVPQNLTEDILRAALKISPNAILVSELEKMVGTRRFKIAKAVQQLIRDDLLEMIGDRLELTESGEEKALRIQRSHRLWETYLQHVGMPTGEIHRHAHQLEHIHEENSVDYLDHILGHPRRDPHGSEIPEDFVHTESGEPVPVSFLREGRRAKIVSLKQAAAHLDLHPGEPIVMGKRPEEGTKWAVVRENGETIILDHNTADATLVDPEPQKRVSRRNVPVESK